MSMDIVKEADIAPSQQITAYTNVKIIHMLYLTCEKRVLITSYDENGFIHVILYKNMIRYVDPSIQL